MTQESSKSASRWYGKIAFYNRNWISVGLALVQNGLNSFRFVPIGLALVQNFGGLTSFMMNFNKKGKK